MRVYEGICGYMSKYEAHTFFRYQIFLIPIPVLFSVPNFSDTGSETFFRYQVFPIPVPRFFSGTNFYRYRFRYHQKNEKFPVPGIPSTGTSHSDMRLYEGIWSYMRSIWGCMRVYEDIWGYMTHIMRVYEAHMTHMIWGIWGYMRVYEGIWGPYEGIWGYLRVYDQTRGFSSV